MTYSGTIERYSLLWSKDFEVGRPEKYHFDAMQEVIPERIVRDGVGLDLGCGLGWDTFAMAENNPSAQLIGMDLSEGAYMASKVTHGLKNAAIMRGNACSIPLKSEACDFIYSFGVLHHIPNYKKGLAETLRVLKAGSPAFLYLYEDHSGNPVKLIAVRAITAVRKITVKIPPGVLHVLACIASPILVLIFSYPAKIFKRFRRTYRLYEKMPFNFGTSLFSLRGDIYDRFATPTEIRFSAEALRKALLECGFDNITISRLKATAGWVAWAYKKN